LRITKAGNTPLRCLLVNCAHYILGRWGPDCDLRAAGLRICARGGSISKKRAVIATARKLAVTLLALWKSGQDYRPLQISLIEHTNFDTLYVLSKQLRLSVSMNLNEKNSMR